MCQIQPFFFNSREVRGLTLDGNPWFVAKDLCDVLEIQNVSQAVSSLDEDERSMYCIGRQGELYIVSESGLYAMVFKSRKPEARAFRKWVTAEVLPALRRTGRFETAGGRTRISRADVFHHRGPVSETGLDIRYTLDLTKVILRPSPRALELAQRLTGVDLSDIAEELTAEAAALAALSAPQESLFEGFCAERLVEAEGGWLLAARVYRAFLDWLNCRPARTDAHGHVLPPPSQNALGRWMRRRYPHRRAVDGIRYLGIGLNGGRA